MIPADKAIITADNRGFRYGDGLFETMRLAASRILLEAYHFERLFAGIKQLEFDFPADLTPAGLSSQILELCKENNCQESARVRLAVFRGEGGLFEANKRAPNYIIQCRPLDKAYRRFNEQGLVTAVFRDGRKSCDHFSNLKTNNYLLYAMAALHAGKNGLDDCIILNSRERPCESAIGNLYCIRDGIVSTPPLSEGCVAGVMRRRLLSLTGAIPFSEKVLTIRDLLDADELFLSNAVYGIRWIKYFEGREYVNLETHSLYNRLFEDLS